MDIGTAKPNETTLKKYPHHLINICHPENSYSAFDFVHDAKAQIKIAVHGEVYSIQHYVIKFVRDLRQVGGFLWVQGTPVSSTNKTNCHDITEIMLKLVLNTIDQLICQQIKSLMQPKNLHICGGKKL
jgi:hypothetical protein